MKRTIIGAALVAASFAALVLAPDSQREGCGAMCCRRPAGAAVEACRRRNPHTGAP